MHSGEVPWAGLLLTDRNFRLVATAAYHDRHPFAIAAPKVKIRRFAASNGSMSCFKKGD
jgi:hypothetical protein